MTSFIRPSTMVITQSKGPILKAGHLRKLKKLKIKKKYFVLRGEASGYLACLECYDSKKNFDCNQSPKRSISLRSCLSINKIKDLKQKHVIALYTEDECFCLVLENETELEEWLDTMLLFQNGRQTDGEKPKPTFEHVWQVNIQKKELGERKNINGPYRLCLTDRTLSLVKLGAKDKSESIDIALNNIRRFGFTKNIFYMEVGRSAATGDGDLFMETEGSNVAFNMNEEIKIAVKNSSNNKEDICPKQRMRSSSANEASKPISVLQRRHTGQKIHSFSPLGITVRDRCDSLPSRARTTSEGQAINTVSSSISHSRAMHLISNISRPHSMHTKGLSYSPPINTMPMSPASAACSTDSAGSSLSMDEGSEVLEEGMVSKYGHSLTPDEPVILEENGEEYAPWAANQLKHSPNFKSHSPLQQSSYVEMCSPCSSSPGKSAYMPMSPATGHSHSRTSSFADDNTTLPDGYVPMAPVHDTEYVDMDPSSNSVNSNFQDDMSQHGGSNCSVTSGTPSTDLRFSEYHLDKITSFLAPGEDSQMSRPTRAYSVGSRPDHISKHRKKTEITQEVPSRVRAFSVGSRSKRPEMGRLVNVITAPLVSGAENANSTKSNSAPVLLNSSTHNIICPVTAERLEDLMELDFTKHSNDQILSPPSHSHSTNTDTSSYVDMSPGQSTGNKIDAYVEMSGPLKEDNSSQFKNQLGNNKTSPVDFPQPRRPPEGYIEMSFKARAKIEKDYMNMTAGNGKHCRKHHQSCHRRKHTSQPIEIKAKSNTNTFNVPTSLPLNQSPKSESLLSTPASPSQTTSSRGSSGTIFPFSLNSPQSPEKSFAQNDTEKSSSFGDVSSTDDYAVMTLIRKNSEPNSNTSSMDTSAIKKANDKRASPNVKKEQSSKVVVSNDHHLFAPVTKKLSNLTVSKPPKLITASPNTSPTPQSFKSSFQVKSTSPKIIEDTLITIPIPTPSSTSNSLDSEGYEKLQPGATLLHYAKLDLPEISGPPPVSPIPAQEVFKYAEIDFKASKVKQN